MYRLATFQPTLIIRTVAILNVFLLGLAVPAGAQPAAPDQHVEEVSTEAPETDETLLNLSAGSALNTGNTRAFQISTGGDFRIVRGQNGLTATAAFVYGKADLPDDESSDFQDTARNFNARARYDHFLTTNDALFIALVHRWDTFAGLDIRLQGQAGYLRNFYSRKNFRLWGELGYDLTYDNYTQEVLDDLVAAGSATIDEDVFVHSARMFLGYDNHLTETFTVLMGVEALVNVEQPEDFRINWDNAFRSKINSSLQVELKFTLKYDNREIPGTRNTDTLTQVNLVYALI